MRAPGRQSRSHRRGGQGDSAATQAGHISHNDQANAEVHPAMQARAGTPSLRNRWAHDLQTVPRGDFQPLRDFGLQGLAVGAGEAQFRRGDADFVVEVEQAAWFGDREKQRGLVAADAEGMRRLVACTLTRLR
jgi:hypothetical protein